MKKATHWVVFFIALETRSSGFSGGPICHRECRYITLGLLDERLVVAVWTLRGNSRRIISFRKANEREQKRYWEQVGRPR
ncbi:BrnT family toxin [Pigmentiphaga sp. H8]|uniref:BrnT family toxin n=1 Tax=Pigmentiphaga sp. H8 TaxID=2488560 RepID=UPI000F596E30|nr:BrnT family toxin [Pigmentiphaga sp. H8]AZG07708.1 BrnT family toxin [Pigmentiphaga sp. H8]